MPLLKRRARVGGWVSAVWGWRALRASASAQSRPPWAAWASRLGLSPVWTSRHRPGAVLLSRSLHNYTCKTINRSRSYVTCAKQFNYRGTNNSNLVQHPTVLHRKLYELNVQIHLGIQQYFEVWINQLHMKSFKISFLGVKANENPLILWYNCVCQLFCHLWYRAKGIVCHNIWGRKEINVWR